MKRIFRKFILRGRYDIIKILCLNILWIITSFDWTPWMSLKGLTKGCQQFHIFFLRLTSNFLYDCFYQFVEYIVAKSCPTWPLESFVWSFIIASIWGTALSLDIYASWILSALVHCILGEPFTLTDRSFPEDELIAFISTNHGIMVVSTSSPVLPHIFSFHILPSCFIGSREYELHSDSLP